MEGSYAGAVLPLPRLHLLPRPHLLLLLLLNLLLQPSIQSPMAPVTFPSDESLRIRLPEWQARDRSGSSSSSSWLTRDSSAGGWPMTSSSWLARAHSQPARDPRPEWMTAAAASADQMTADAAAEMARDTRSHGWQDDDKEVEQLEEWREEEQEEEEERVRERATRGTGRRSDTRKSSGLRLGDSRGNNDQKQKCPEASKLKPCQCKERTSGLDITCEGVKLEELKIVTENLKAHNQVSSSEYMIGYFKIRDCSIPRLPDYIFMGLKIVHLLIYNCDIATLMPNSLSSLAGSLKHLVLSNNKLQEVPKMALRQLRELDHLNLNENEITVIRDGAFWGLSKVTRLSLYDNKLKNIENGAFDGLTKDLLRLNVGRNHLSEFPKEAIVTLKNLNQLDLSENKIAALKAGDFMGMDRLDTLSLNHNIFHELGAGWFEGLNKLTSLSLDYNKIVDVDRDAFKGLEEQLQSLSLTNNKINVFPSEALRPLHQLTTLHLDDNNITRLEEGAFEGFGEHIKNLWLQNNHLSKLPLNTFEDLHSLEWLKLYNNELVTLHYELMEPVLDTLKHIDIHSNPLLCDCEMRWYRKWFNAEWQEIDTDYIKLTHCTDPEDQREHLISEVSMEHMYCVKAEEFPVPDSAPTHYHYHHQLISIAVALGMPFLISYSI